MNILETEIEGYQRLRKKAERILTECQKLTDFTKLNKMIGCNLEKEYTDIYIAYKEFKRSVLKLGKMSEKDYVFRVGVLEGRISERVKMIQIAVNRNIILKGKLEEFLLAKNEVTQYLLGIMD